MIPAILTIFCLISAFILLLLLSLSIPIIKTIFLFKLSAHVSSFLHSSISGIVEFGVWGYCVSGLDASVLGFSEKTNGYCSKAKLGYTFDDTIATLLHVEQYKNLITRGLTAVLVLHPIACVLTFLSLVASLSLLRRNTTTRGASLITLILGLAAAVITTIVFLIDVILVAVVRHHVSKDTDNVLALTWGNAVWMALGATIALWIANFSSCLGLFQRRRASRNGDAKY